MNGAPNETHAPFKNESKMNFEKKKTVYFVMMDILYTSRNDVYGISIISGKN